VWRRIDGQRQEPAQVLQPILHGSGDGDYPDIRGEWSISGPASLFGGLLRAMWGDLETASAPQGRRCHKQSIKQHCDPLREVPLARAHEAAKDFDLRSLWDGLCCQAPSIQSQDLRCWMCGDLGPHQCTKAKGSRVGRLRAYGNAIVPAVAAQFITACMEA
jgi:hypothetical protein